MLKKIYRLSDEGNRSIMSASFLMSLFQLATMSPVVLLAMIAGEMLERYFDQTEAGISLWMYWGISLAILLAIFFTYKVTYRKKYIASGKEDFILRMNLADKMRKLPLSYFGKRDLSDFTSTIMDDVAVVENALATGVTEFISGCASGILTLAVMFIYDWRLSLCLAICIPAAALVMGVCRAISEGTNRRNKNKKLAISDGLQEYLESLKQRGSG